MPVKTPKQAQSKGVARGMASNDRGAPPGGGCFAEPREPARPSEAGALADEMALAFRRMLEIYHGEHGLSPADAEKTMEEQSAHLLQRAPAKPAKHISWFELGSLAKHDADRAAECWESIKRAATDELHTGHRSALAVEGFDKQPWRRAQFLAIRQDLQEAWQPKDGLERQLVDTLAEARSSLLFWQEVLAGRSSAICLNTPRNGAWEPPRVSQAEATEQAAVMVDRFNKTFVRTLRALRDLRRYYSSVVIQNVGQVNVGQQQVNLAT